MIHTSIYILSRIKRVGIDLQFAFQCCFCHARHFLPSHAALCQCYFPFIFCPFLFLFLFSFGCILFFLFGHFFFQRVCWFLFRFFVWSSLSLSFLSILALYFIRYYYLNMFADFIISRIRSLVRSLSQPSLL